jgi:uncharacterized phiE125 gp8 family phage protein
MALKLISGSTPIASLAEAKRHCRVYHDDDDDYIQALVATATAWVDGKDGWLGRAIGTQTWDYVLDGFPVGAGPKGGGIRIPLPPLQSVVSVEYVDPDTGLEAALEDGADYETDAYSEPGWIMPSSAGWPTTMNTINSVRIRFIAGYVAVPASIKHAVLLMVGHLYENREATTIDKPSELPMGVEALLIPYRNWVS